MMSDDEPFVLANDPPRRVPVRFENDDRRQRTLFDGLDCLPGQEDLFADDDDRPMQPGPFTDALRDAVVEHWLFTFPCRSLDDLNPWGGCCSDRFYYSGRPEGLHVKTVHRVIVDATMSWSEFKRRATKLAVPCLFH